MVLFAWWLWVMVVVVVVDVCCARGREGGGDKAQGAKAARSPVRSVGAKEYVIRLWICQATRSYNQPLACGGHSRYRRWND